MSEEKKGFFARLKEGLTKTRDNIVRGIDLVFSGFSAIDDDFYEELEEILIMGDIGVNATTAIVERLKQQVKEKHIKEPSECKQLLIESIKEQMQVDETAYDFEKEQSVIMVIGVNGVGKTTLAQQLAESLHVAYLDTGAMFRTIGLYALRKGVDPKDNAAVNTLLPEIGLRVDCIDGEQHIYLNGEDVSTAIRTEEAGMAASAVGANPEVRAFLLELQRGMTKTQNVLMDGRDIGTVVLPDATVKIFLTAAPEARARRRWLEYQQKGMEVAFEDVLADVKQRDYQDTHRAAAPLKQAEDAVLLDTSDLNFEQSLAAMKKIIAEKVN